MKESKWIHIACRMPKERELVVIHGPFNTHHEAIDIAFWEFRGPFKGRYYWYEKGHDILLDSDWLAYSHEVFHWLPLQDKPYPKEPNDFGSFSTNYKCEYCLD